MITFPIYIDIYRQTVTGVEFVTQIGLAGPGAYAIGRSENNQIRLDAPEVSREHAWLEVRNDGFTVSDRGSSWKTMIGDAEVQQSAWDGRVPIRIHPFELRLAGAQPTPRPAGAPAGGGQSPLQTEPPQRELRAELTPKPEASLNLALDSNTRIQAQQAASVEMSFPSALFNAPIVSVDALRRSGYYVGEVDYLALGGGMGSFTWIDHLRVFGVPKHQIRAIGEMDAPYNTYRRLCKNSQIPDHERLRSNSISAPDNVWGFPGYASRETWRNIKKGNLGGLKYVWQVFGEPAIAESYTPIIGDVFISMDREMARIGWRDMMINARVLGLRRTDDGRYAVAYRTPSDRAHAGRRDNIIVGRFVQIATGYPATRFTEDLQDFKRRFPDHSNRVVNAYEDHDALYIRLEQANRPMTVVVRGRGIVASRIIQRLDEARKRNPRIEVIHLMRSPLTQAPGTPLVKAKRWVFNHTEHQPFNWPKSCWGGELRKEIEDSDPDERQRYFRDLGGTTTAVRSDWIKIIETGKQEGWFRNLFGNFDQMHVMPHGNEHRVVIKVVSPDRSQSVDVATDFIVDCTGLVGDVQNSPFLKDLIDTFRLPRNKVAGEGAQQSFAGITVSNDFEIQALRAPNGRAYAAGTVTSNGPYAAVDSFLGLQYAALRSVDHLNEIGAPGVSSFGPLRSSAQWFKWCFNLQP